MRDLSRRFVSGTRRASAVAIRTALWLGCRPAVEGARHLPPSGPFVLVANHSSHLDTAVLLSLLPLGALDRAFPVAAREYFGASRLLARATTLLFNVVALDRDVPPCRAIASCRRLLEHDAVLVLYPEGTRSLDGRVAPFKAGVGLLVAGLDVPVVPCAIAGALDAWPKGARFPRPHPIRVRVGAPLMFAGVDRTKAGAKTIAEALHSAVLDLSEGDSHAHDHRRAARPHVLRRALGWVNDRLPSLVAARPHDARRRPLPPRP